MKITPLLFNSDMVRALLLGRKTMTRQIVKPQPLNYAEPIDCDGAVHVFFEYKGVEYHEDDFAFECCPLGKKGDLLWVRETFAYEYNLDGEAPLEPNQYLYAATESWSGKKIPSIHMPRKANRLTLKITDVRVECVQDISEHDSINEGIKPNCALINHGDCNHDEWFHYERDDEDFPAFSAKESFQSLWNSINNNWDQNPWVWCISFEVINKNVDDYLEVLK